MKDLGWYWGEWAFAYCKEKETKKTKGICAIIQVNFFLKKTIKKMDLFEQTYFFLKGNCRRCL